MITEKMLTALNDIDDEMIADAAPGSRYERISYTQRRRRIYRVAALAACLCIVVAVLAMTGLGESLINRGGEDRNMAPSGDGMSAPESAGSNGGKNIEQELSWDGNEMQVPVKISLSDIAVPDGWTDGSVTVRDVDPAQNDGPDGDIINIDAPETAVVYSSGTLLGEYPVIGPEEALKLLESGKTDGYCEAQFPGKDNVVAAEYRDASVTQPATASESGGISVPFYVFTVRLPEEAAKKYGGGEGKAVYAHYYVIAIDPDYLE